jgi:5-methylcytosine-specific restriction protein A
MLGSKQEAILPTKGQFRKEIRAQLRDAELGGIASIEINSGQLHRKLGGYPGENHQMRPCCEAMYDEKEAGDAVLSAPKKGHGASVTIRYGLPRRPHR